LHRLPLAHVENRIEHTELGVKKTVSMKSIILNAKDAKDAEVDFKLGLGTDFKKAMFFTTEAIGDSQRKPDSWENRVCNESDVFLPQRSHWKAASQSFTG
jgi:hypothetical protein